MWEMTHAANALFYCTQVLCCLWLCDQLTRPRVVREYPIIVRPVEAADADDASTADAPLPLMAVRP